MAPHSSTLTWKIPWMEDVSTYVPLSGSTTPRVPVRVRVFLCAGTGVPGQRGVRTGCSEAGRVAAAQRSVFARPQPHLPLQGPWLSAADGGVGGPGGLGSVSPSPHRRENLPG